MKRTRQRDRLLSLLQEHVNEEVPLPKILLLGIAQYGARILELRRMGHIILNRTERHSDGTHSWFKLVKDV